MAVEADWPDAYRANRWVRLLGDDDTAEAALADFTRFRRWMWRNRDVVRFLRWLRAENAERPVDARVGFYGLDLYSLHRSIGRVIEYLDKVDPGAAQRARRGYACFDVFGEDVQLYGYAANGWPWSRSALTITCRARSYDCAFSRGRSFAWRDRGQCGLSGTTEALSVPWKSRRRQAACSAWRFGRPRCPRKSMAWRRVRSGRNVHWPQPNRAVTVRTGGSRRDLEAFRVGFAGNPMAPA